MSNCLCLVCKSVLSQPIQTPQMASYQSVWSGSKFLALCERFYLAGVPRCSLIKLLQRFQDEKL